MLADPTTGSRAMANATSASLPSDEGSIGILEYVTAIAGTDKLPKGDIRPVLLGLFGEVGEMMATVKKTRREDLAYVDAARASIEELGDALWYLATLCTRLAIPLDEIFSTAARLEQIGTVIAANDRDNWPIAQIPLIAMADDLVDELILLGERTAALLPIPGAGDRTHELLIAFARSYLRVVRASNLSFATIARKNVDKTVGRFREPAPETLSDFDKGFETEEQLPREFEISISQRKSGKTHMSWKGVFIGDPLTDNIRDPDGYRFHDVFHFAYAAILHWSPVVRALIKHKRRSDQKFDEGEDGGRAIVVEEGLTAWIFSRAKSTNFFADQDKLPFDLLKTVGEFVSGYEVADCPLRLWERAILDGYKVFRDIRKNEGGVIVGNRAERTIAYKPIGGR